MLGIFEFFRRDRSASQAKERLQILVAHDRVGRDSPDYLPLLQRDLIAVIARYVEIDEEKLSVELANQGGFSMLAVNIELPSRSQKSEARNQKGPIRTRPQLA
jgi:cell division topological specificity factor